MKQAIPSNNMRLVSFVKCMPNKPINLRAKKFLMKRNYVYYPYLFNTDMRLEEEIQLYQFAQGVRSDADRHVLKLSQITYTIRKIYQLIATQFKSL